MKNNTFLSIASGAIKDLAGLNVNSVTLSVNNFTGDTTPPEVRMFNLHIGDGTLTIEFSESVDVSNFNIANITLQNAENDSEANFTLQLSGGSISPNTTAVILTITLSMNDADEIRLQMLTTIYLAIVEGAVLDSFNNPLAGISTDMALNAEATIIDEIPPELLDFSLDLKSWSIGIGLLMK